MSTPKRRIETAWGPLLATCLRPDRIICSTVSPEGEEPSGLRIEGNLYCCVVELISCGPDAANEEGVQPINDQWGAQCGWRSLTPAGDVVVSNECIGQAVEVLRWHILPVVATWLGSVEAQVLLAEGTTWWRETYLLLAKSSEYALVAAWERLQTIRHELQVGVVISIDDERFLQRLDPAVYSRRIEMIGGNSSAE
jgi:hypothetical protein